tara:strand:+ start:5551 stop:6792 length:1242 start_codon:yes stop_codon:yes gene_type:complete
MSKKFCSVPWRELTFSSQNQYSVCCKWDESKSVGLVDSNNSINEHWNGKLMKDLRQKFINGDNIPECAWCWKDEKANKVSARLRRNQHYYGQADIKIGDSVIADTLKNTETDGSYKAPDIQGLFISVGDKCQLRCIHCSPAYSRSILKDYEKLGWDENYKARRKVKFDVDTKNATHNHWAQIKSLVTDKIVVIRVTGGEPSINPQFVDFLKYCVENNYSQHIDIFIATNLVTMKQDYLDLLKQFRQTTLAVSLDGHGALEEYIRWPTNWDRKCKNLDYVKKHFKITVNTTVNSLNVLRINEIIEWVEQNEILHNLEILQYPNNLQARHLPKELKLQTKNLLMKYITDAEYKLDDNYDKLPYRTQCIKAIINSLDHKEDPAMQKQLKNIVLGYDKIRPVKLKQIIPEFKWLDKI